MDNTWASPLYFRALEKGVDITIQSGTKYISGHSDLMFGTAAANTATWPQLRDTVHEMGLCAGPDDVYLALRGLRTMGVRLARHQESGLAVARWLEARPGGLARVAPGACLRIPATRSGSEISSARRGFSASYSSRCRTRRCTPSSTR